MDNKEALSCWIYVEEGFYYMKEEGSFITDNSPFFFSSNFGKRAAEIFWQNNFAVDRLILQFGIEIIASFRSQSQECHEEDCWDQDLQDGHQPMPLLSRMKTCTLNFDFRDFTLIMKFFHSKMKTFFPVEEKFIFISR